jgi:Tfp pilus assembly major pilin PilA
MGVVHMNRTTGVSRPQGITFMSFIIVLVVVGFAAYIAMRLVPVYQEYFSVRQAMKAVADEAGPNTSPAQIRQMLGRRFDISYVDNVRPQDIRVIRDGRGTQLNIAYQRITPFIGNIEFLITFDETVELSSRPSASD